MALIDDDRNVGGVTRDLAEAIARELAALYEQLAALYESGFVETAGPRRLLRLAAVMLVILGIVCALKHRKRSAS